MFGYQLPKNFEDALRLEEENGTTQWQDAVELDQGLPSLQDEES